MEFAAALPGVTAIFSPLSSSDYRTKMTIPLKKQATYQGSTSSSPEKGTLVYYVVTDNLGAPFTTPTSITRSAINTRLTWTDD